MTRYLYIMTRGNKLGAPFIDLQLRSSELQAIGHVIAQWAFLEFLILRETHGLARYLKLSVPEDAEAVSFKKRQRAWKELAAKALHDLPEELTRTHNLIRQVDGAASERHRLTHDIIEARLPKPEPVEGISALKPAQIRLAT